MLDAVMRCFRAQGYEGTSVRDLADRIGITGASLYNAFGDKRSLHRRALEFYFEQSVRDRVTRLEKGLPPLAAIRAFFDEIVERSGTDPECRGCMLVNSSLEATLKDPELRAAVAQEFMLIEAFLRRCVAAGQMDGTVTARQVPDALAKLLLNVLLGVRARPRPQRAVLEGAAQGALGLLKSDERRGAAV